MSSKPYKEMSLEELRMEKLRLLDLIARQRHNPIALKQNNKSLQNINQLIKSKVDNNKLRRFKEHYLFN